MTLPLGEIVADLVMAEQHLKFFVDPAGIYVRMDQYNPIFLDQTPFHAIGPASNRSTSPIDLPADMTSLTSSATPYDVIETVAFTNYGIAENGYDLLFFIDLASCGASRKHGPSARQWLARPRVGCAP